MAASGASSQARLGSTCDAVSHAWHVGCCDSSPNRHATAHNASSGHPLIQSFEPGEDWYWCFVDEMGFMPENQGPSPSHA